MSLTGHHRRLVVRGAAPRADLPMLLAEFAEEFRTLDATVRMVGDEVQFRVTSTYPRRNWRTLAPLSGGRVAATVRGDDVVIDMSADFGKQTVILGALLGFGLVAMVQLGMTAGSIAALLAGSAVLFALQRCFFVVQFGDLVDEIAKDSLPGGTLAMPRRHPRRSVR